MVELTENDILNNIKCINELTNIDNNVKLGEVHEDYFDFNMSMLQENEKTLIAFRSSDFKPPANYAGKISFISLAELYDNKINNVHRIYTHGYGIKLWDKYNAMEDPKLIKWKNDVWCIFTRPNFYITNITMAMVNLNTGELIRFEDPLGRQFTKNWMPYIEDDNLFFLTDVDPIRVYLYDKNKLIEIKNNNIKKYEYLIHGSSNIINYNNGKIGVIHGRFMHENRWTYWHRIITMNDDWDIVSAGPLFFFEQLGIEFSLCILQTKDGFIIPYSTNDQGLNYIFMSDDNFRKLL